LSDLLSLTFVASALLYNSTPLIVSIQLTSTIKDCLTNKFLIKALDPVLKNQIKD